jgi:hypothetical protein
MSLSERLKKAIDGFRLKQEETLHITVIPPIEAKPAKKPSAPPIYTEGWKGQPRRTYAGGDFVDVMELRRLALTPTPYMCIQRLINDIVSTQWEIKPLAKENQTEPDQNAIEHARMIRDWFIFNLNENREPFAHLLTKAVNDLLVLDAGVFFKEYAKGSSHYMVQLWSADGGLFWKEVDVFQRIGKIYAGVSIGDKLHKNYKVGYWFNPMGEPNIPWELHEVIYMMQAPRTDICYGTSKMQILKTIVGSLMYGEEYYYDFWKAGGVGSIMIGTKEALTEPVWKEWSDRIKEKLKGEFIKTLPLDHEPSVQPLGLSPKDMQWLETKDEYRHLVMALFNTTPVMHGFTADIHRATDESQKSVYIKNGLYPLLKSLEWYFNTQIITEFYWDEPSTREYYTHGHKGKWAGQEIDCLFRFKLYDPIGEKQELAIDEQKLKNGFATINEIRKQNGEKPLSWGDLNPLFLLNPQQWAQSFYFKALTPESFASLTGAPMPKEVLEAVKPATTPQEDATAFKMSRMEKVDRTMQKGVEE